ncbi:hypothetical protein HHL16_19155 [Pseudoflavitalea sp. G-6-1-2]|uniref:hypothetical protein n=1 Tax=Pseudoflavitalea sp. G-6-1-2 TaxID=2728841 RepID=UPI00146A5CD7|nr:hypothetical protein [Pseudoflavitalea sp. G-6-1-2]NML23004.1 hypothetical protein [Pseudoflavitalea sp. G-6-1-2]
MKNYLFGTIAVLFALIGVAFTSPPKKSITYVQFVGNPVFLFDVEDETLWEEVFSIPFCNGVNQQACRIRIDDSRLTTNPGGPFLPRVLDGTLVQVSAARGINPSYYIPVWLYGSPGLYTITNRN